jgi:hypothetical protein
MESRATIAIALEVAGTGKNSAHKDKASLL